MNEIRNKLKITPAYLHTDQGGEFSAKTFVDKLKARGICFEQGPPDSPQTNGVSERFNQSLLSKMRCIIGQSNVPTYLWDEAAKHASFLLNQLPHKYLNFKSPIDKLEESNSKIEPRIDFNKILPFGIKVIVKKNITQGKVDMPGKTMRALTFESYSDALRVLDPQTGQIKITQDYAVSLNPMNLVLRQPENTLPQDSAIKIVLKVPSPNKPSTQTKPIQESLVENQDPLPVPLNSGESQRVSIGKHYDYVPFYEKPEKNISSKISPDNIIEGKRSKKLPN
ncbi:hypothetical protein O181_064346 [Austropuccinia psidii MF-1]|uniref:Integrase catalytic domain-containing protein n=1 Tax=Austropuccinia psidii MF-1 TaxID=1389203 RepID=A0A9Q3ETH9_9BASI|nr:hypothetical protein [Austropuccinia psidii MF-1]